MYLRKRGERSSVAERRKELARFQNPCKYPTPGSGGVGRVDVSRGCLHAGHDNAFSGARLDTSSVVGMVSKIRELQNARLKTTGGSIVPSGKCNGDGDIFLSLFVDEPGWEAEEC